MSELSKKFVPIVLCAGLGSRLRPLTYCLPKVVAPLGDVPISFTSIRRFLDAGFEQVHCNTHYLADTVEAELRAAMSAFGYEQSRLRCWRETELLNSGGGIQRIWEGLVSENEATRNKDVIVVSGDLYSNLPLEEMLADWSLRKPNETTQFGTKQLFEERPDVTWVDMSTCLIKGFGRDHTKEAGYTARNFTGQQIIAAECLRKARVAAVSSIDLYYRAALSRGEVIRHFTYDEAFHWYNIGTYQEFSEAMKDKSVAGLRLLSLKDCLLIKTDKPDKQNSNQKTNSLINYQVNTLRTIPKLGNESLVTLIKGLLTKGTEPCLGGVGLNPNALVFALAAARSLGDFNALAKPLLVPLELLNPEWLPSLDCSPYLTSQTYLLI